MLMRKRISVKLPTFFKALENLGYQEAHNGFRKGKFHMIVNRGKSGVNVSLHVDIPEYKVGPVHRSRQYGKDISEEFKRIKEEYKRLRERKS
jgi:hypothetical protein